jgi:hypothetical protein
MPSTGATATTGRREFRARFGWGHLAASCGLFAVLLAAAGGAACCALATRRELLAEWSAWGTALPASETRQWVVAILLNLLAPSLMAVLVVAWAQEGARAGATVTADVIAVTDRRGRRTEVPWGDARELWLVGWAGPGGVPRMRLKTPTKVVKIPDLIREREPLMGEIVTRAGLTERHQGWVQVVYRRDTGVRAGDEG